MSIALAVRQFALVAVCGATVVPVQQPWEAADLAARLVAIMGDGAIDCGRHRLRALLEPADGSEILQASLDCGLKARGENRPFQIVVHHTSIDSWQAHGLVGTPSGEIRKFSYGSMPCGGRGCPPHFETKMCVAPVVRTPPKRLISYYCEP